MRVVSKCLNQSLQSQSLGIYVFKLTSCDTQTDGHSTQPFIVEDYRVSPTTNLIWALGDLVGVVRHFPSITNVERTRNLLCDSCVTTLHIQLIQHAELFVTMNLG